MQIKKKTACKSEGQVPDLVDPMFVVTEGILLPPLGGFGAGGVARQATTPAQGVSACVSLNTSA